MSRVVRVRQQTRACIPRRRSMRRPRNSAALTNTLGSRNLVVSFTQAIGICPKGQRGILALAQETSGLVGT